MKMKFQFDPNEFNDDHFQKTIGEYSQPIALSRIAIPLRSQCNRICEALTHKREMNENDLIAEQIDYYRARAAEYDQWHLRCGRYDRGEAHRSQWFKELDIVRGDLAAQRPFGSVLELACGTGLWTPCLARGASSLTAIDAVPETIKINRQKTRNAKVDYRVADIFRWQPDRPYDFIFFGFWLSHVPASRFEGFWNLLRQALCRSGRVFFVDSLFTQASTAIDHAPIGNSGMVERKLNDGTRYKIVKRFYERPALERDLATLGWRADLKISRAFFLYGSATIRQEADCGLNRSSASRAARFPGSGQGKGSGP